ncbi:hypothetical protein FSP39_000285 [Pinctada imbricata]|uniref:Fibrinogen C-terminal domain-containing protein n=1 Tax=Pinctada imbricata TaxID=66713 RepID=A0AA88XKB8_PINIB|nr:hypothetical protein FSP39_000285 [Pinctada imbricata]
MGELKVEMAADKELAGKEKKEDANASRVNIALVASLLVAAAALAASVYYPSAKLVEEVKDLVRLMENITKTNSMSEHQVVAEAEIPRDCYDIQLYGHVTSGVYKIYPGGIKRGIDVYCDMDTDNGGWLVFQRRIDGTLDFYKNWAEYQIGFGDLSSEFWLGTESLHIITDQGFYERRVDMTDFDGQHRYAQYRGVHIGDRDTKYKLRLAGYHGYAGDSLYAHNNMKFSARDHDNDNAGGHCAETFKGGFWYNNCHAANPNGQYLSGDHETLANGINWHSWRGYKYSLKTIEMKIRPL